ncbi:MAG: DUF2232 domain-containing protein [Proteobacteria bacterium]|nr:MAG: DUF2232 domain-containing protein [Pseudomonadota bacterium]
MSNPKSPLKFIGLLSLTALITPVIGPFGAVPMRTIRRAFGRWAFWSALLALAGVFFAVNLPVQGVFVLALTIMVGVFAEVEEHGGSIFSSALVGMLASVGTIAIGATLWLMQTKTTIMGQVRTYAAEVVKQAQAVNPEVTLEVDTLIRTLPSAIVVTLLVAMAVALVWDRPVGAFFRVASTSQTGGDKLRSFRVPDAFVWLVATSIFAAFYKHGSPLAETIGLNVFYAMIAIYFFQGVAVIAQGFKTFKVGAFWQAAWCLIIIVQFYAVAFLGFADYWIDFRSRMTSKPAPPKNAFKNQN